MITPAYAPTANERVLPRLALDFTTAVLDPRVTVTRALNTATITNSSGIVEIVNANLPRFDYANGVCRGLLIEEARTNVILTSTFATLAGSAGAQYPSGTGWSNFFSTGGTRTYVASSVFPAAQAMDIASVSAARNVIGFSFTAAASTTYTVSFYIESLSGVSGVIAIATGALGTGGTSNNIANPTTTGRYSYTFTTGTSPGSVDLRFGIGASTNASGSIRISNVQCEAGAFATSYIPTTTTSLTRNADVVQMTGTNFSSWFNAAEGSFSAQYDRIGIKRYSRVFAASNVAESEQITVISGLQADGRENGNIAVASVNNILYPANTPAANLVTRFCLSYKTGSSAASMNASSVATSAAAFANPAPTQLNIGSIVTSGQYLNGHVQELLYWPQALTNAEVQTFAKVG